MNLVAAVFVFFAFLADIVSTSAQQIGEINLLHCYVFLKRKNVVIDISKFVFLKGTKFAGQAIFDK